MSGTGKTSLSCHSHWLKHPERVIIRQDDVVILRQDGSAIGTEESFYLKTDGLEPNSQPFLYASAVSPRAILENVWVDPKTGKVDFFNTTLTSNGRGMVKRSDIAYTDHEVDLERTDFVVFINRRYDILPPVVRLNDEWERPLLCWVNLSKPLPATRPRLGNRLRVVGTNPFIVGSEAEEGNIFLGILRRNPGIQCFILNTGMVGGRNTGQKITVHDSVKIMEMIARDKIIWKKDPFWGYDVPVEIPGVDLSRFELTKFYTDEEIQAPL